MAFTTIRICIVNIIHTHTHTPKLSKSVGRFSPLAYGERGAVHLIGPARLLIAIPRMSRVPHPYTPHTHAHKRTYSPTISVVSLRARGRFARSLTSGRRPPPFVTSGTRASGVSEMKNISRHQTQQRPWREESERGANFLGSDF